MKSRNLTIRKRGHEISANYMDGSGVTGILLVHGAFVDKDPYSAFAEEISESYPVLVPDIVPHGKSKIFYETGRVADSKINYRHAIESLDICSEALKEMGMKNVISVGHSLGGIICSNFAEKNENVKGVVEICSPESEYVNYFPLFKIIKFAPKEIPLPTKIFRMNRIVGEEVANFLDNYIDTKKTRYPRFFESLLETKTYKPLIESEKPSLVLFSEEDILTNKIHGFLKEMGDTYDRITVESIDGGHAAPCIEEYAGPIAETIIGFIDGLYL